MAGRFKELMKKYGKVGLGVHVSVSSASVTGLYIAIKNNIDVESMLEKVGMPSLSKEKTETSSPPAENPEMRTASDSEFRYVRTVETKERNRTTELVASSGGALALAVLINKALFPVRVPITLALTPPVARFLARRNIVKNSL
ncbi:putative membrane protein [Handroanthus impetiginosus]|uniref:Putative membrane protein n=1 Tax=Handroanthus impetiginosus TaxID=429701 RepID=A0A2G9HNN5_9LAMI|nr:putative membrane protein [Handroanthus impetiginosus]